MGAPGWDDSPPARFKVSSDLHRHVTLIWPYYENPIWLGQQLRYLASMPEELRRGFALIVIDDGSPQHPAREVFLDQSRLGFTARLFRINVDVRWNWLAARNIGGHHAEGWCLFTDIDHTLPRETLKGLQSVTSISADKFYRLRRTDRGEREIHDHPNTFFCHVDLFRKAGGYDEELSGHYGTDGDWRRRAAATAPVEMLPLYLDRWEHAGDSSTRHYKRKQLQDAGKKAIIRTRGPGWRPRFLSFPYEEIKL